MPRRRAVSATRVAPDERVAVTEPVDLEVCEHRVDRMRGAVDERRRPAACALVVADLPRCRRGIGVLEGGAGERLVERHAALERGREHERFEGRSGLPSGTPAVVAEREIHLATAQQTVVCFVLPSSQSG